MFKKTADLVAVGTPNREEWNRGRFATMIHHVSFEGKAKHVSTTSRATQIVFLAAVHLLDVLLQICQNTGLLQSTLFTIFKAILSQ